MENFTFLYLHLLVKRYHSIHFYISNQHQTVLIRYPLSPVIKDNIIRN